MTDMWRSLLDVLDETLALYRQLLVLSEEKRKLLIQARPGALEEHSRRIEALALEGVTLENRRAAATAVIVTVAGLSQSSPTLAELSAAAEPDIADRLQAFNDDFSVLLREHTRIQTINTKLIGQALAFVNYNMNLLTRSRADNTYAPAGKMPQQIPTFALLDRKV